MAAATVNIPAIALSVGPMLNGWQAGKRVGSGVVIWKAREMLATGQIDFEGFISSVAASAPSVGHCNTMGTATTMNSLAEAMGMQLPGSAAIPAPYRARAQIAYETGKRIVEMVYEDLKPSDILTRASFLNAIVVNSALGGSTNAPIHLAAIARHSGIELSIEDWQQYGRNVPLLVNLQPAGAYLAEDFYLAGGVPSVLGELISGNLIDESCMTVNGQTIGANYRGRVSHSSEVIRAVADPMQESAGFIVMHGNLFETAILKTSAIGDDFRRRYLSNPADPDAFEGDAVVFDGPEDYHAHIDDPELGVTECSILVMRGTGPIGYPGSAEVVNMRPPKQLLARGVTSLPCLGDGRQSGTSGSPSIVNASPEAAAGGNLALLVTGDRLRIDLRKGRVDLLVSNDELVMRRARLNAIGGFQVPQSQTPWQALQRAQVGQLATGAVLEDAVAFQKVLATRGGPRDNH
jgi:dihydroxy-acid dehydratase